MKRRTALLLLACGPAFAQGLPPAGSLLDRFIEVTGGQAAYDARKSEIAHGTVELAAMGLKGKVTRYAGANDSYRLVMELPGIGTMETGVKDGVVWERSELLGPRIKSGTERAEALREAKLNANARWRELYPKVETTGEEVVDGEECYKVLMTPEEGPAETLYLSKRTGLAKKMTAVASTQMGDIPAEILFQEYKDLGGILTPSKVTEKAAGQEITITIDAVEVNPQIPASRFDLPADVAALAAK